MLMKVASFFYPILFILLSMKCTNRPTNNCDYISITQDLLQNIKERRVGEIKKMLAFSNEEFWQEGGDWEIISNISTKGLDSIIDVKSLKYELTIFKDEALSYAIVSVVTKKYSETEFDIIEVRFLNPKSPFLCKIESFNYIKKGGSFKIRHVLPDSMYRSSKF